MEEIRAVITAARPGVKPTTINAYIASLKWIMGAITDGDDLTDALKDTEQVISAISTGTPSTQRNRFNSVIVFLRAVGYEDDDEILKAYIAERDGKQKQYLDSIANGDKTEREEQGMISDDEYKALLATLAGKVAKLKVKKGKLNRPEWQDWLGYLLLSVYYRMPLRNDFANMKVITANAFRANRAAVADNKNNYLIIGPKSAQFLLNNYKTNRKFGKVFHVIPKELATIIRQYLARVGGDNFIINSAGEPMSKDAVSRFISNLTNKYNGRTTGINMLRKSYLSNKYGDVKEAMKADAELMGHSVNTQQNIYVRNGKDEE